MYAAKAFFDLALEFPDGPKAVFERSIVSLKQADCGCKNNRLIGANVRFLQLTGHEAHKVIVHNWRFLQPYGGERVPNLVYLSKVAHRGNGRTGAVLSVQSVHP